MNIYKIVHKNTVNLTDTECMWRPNKKKNMTIGYQIHHNTHFFIKIVSQPHIIEKIRKTSNYNLKAHKKISKSIIEKNSPY